MPAGSTSIFRMLGGRQFPGTAGRLGAMLMDRRQDGAQDNGTGRNGKVLILLYVTGR